MRAAARVDEDRRGGRRGRRRRRWPREREWSRRTDATSVMDNLRHKNVTAVATMDESCSPSGHKRPRWTRITAVAVAAAEDEVRGRGRRERRYGRGGRGPWPRRTQVTSAETRTRAVVRWP